MALKSIVKRVANLAAEPDVKRQSGLDLASKGADPEIVKALAKQLRDQGVGNWDIGGIDRATEFAQQLALGGVKSLADISIETRPGVKGSQYLLSSGEGGEQYATSPDIPESYGLRFGDGTVFNGWGRAPKYAHGGIMPMPEYYRPDGFDPSLSLARDFSLGDLSFTNESGVLVAMGPAPESTGGPHSFMIGRSGAGDGQTDLMAVKGPDGKVRLVPQWGDAYSADRAAIGGVLAVLGTGLAANAMGLGNAAGGGGGLMGPPVEAAGGLMGPPVEAAGLGALETAPLSYAPVGAESSFELMNAGAAADAGLGQAAAIDGYGTFMGVPIDGGLGSMVAPPLESGFGATLNIPTYGNVGAGLGATGLAAADAAPAVFNAAKDSQAANAAMQAAGTPTGAAIAPKGVNLVNAGGVASASGGGWGVLDPIAGALDSAKGAVAGVVGDKGADLLWNLGKGAIGTALAGGAANAMAPKVDTSGLEANAAAARDIANRQMTLAERQYADQKALLDQYSPMIQDLIKGQLTDQGISRDRATSQWNDYTTTWRPLEQQLASSAASWGSPARYQQEADRAGVDAATQFDRAKQAQVRQLQMSGASPEKIAALTSAGDILAARGVAGARSQAYRDSEMKGLNVLQGAASFGRNMPSTGIQTAALAGQQGAQGMAGVQGLSSLSAAPATIASNLMSQSLNANNTATQSLLQAQNMGLQAANQRNAIFGDILGAGLGAIGMSGGFGNLFGGGKP